MVMFAACLDDTDLNAILVPSQRQCLVHPAWCFSSVSSLLGAAPDFITSVHLNPSVKGTALLPFPGD